MWNMQSFAWNWSGLGCFADVPFGGNTSTIESRTFAAASFAIRRMSR
jgi:hypothetical protein